MNDLCVLLFSQFSFADLFSRMMVRLLLAAVLGGAIGFERELKRRPAGLRTNILICFGAAMFTILSVELAGGFGGERTRIASQIIPGIGFIGAGSILRARGGISGLTTAATIFVVASIGMACGGGLYSLAVFATVLILICLELLGWMEREFNLKSMLMNYSVLTDKTSDEIVAEVNAVLQDEGKQMQTMHFSKINGMNRLVFSVDGTHSEHKELTARLRQSPDLKNLAAQPAREAD